MAVPLSCPFSAVARAYCVHQLLSLVLIPEEPLWRSLCALLVCCCAAWPSPLTLLLAIGSRLVDTLYKVPIVWDSFYWCLQVDGGMFSLLVFLVIIQRHHADRRLVAAWWADTARLQLSLFYLASGFWKINTSFLDARTSCAPIFVLTLLPTLGLVPPTNLAPLLAQVSPAITIVGEMSIGVLLLAPRKRLVKGGVLLALLLHLGIALTPPPNNAVPFSLTCVVRLLLLHPVGLARVVDDTVAPFDSIDELAGRVTAAIAVAAAAVAAAVVYARTAAFPPTPLPVGVDWWAFAYAALAVFCARAVLRADDADGETTPTTIWWKTAFGPTVAPPALRPAFVALAVFYGFGGPLLGVQDLGSCNSARPLSQAMLHPSRFERRPPARTL